MFLILMTGTCYKDVSFSNDWAHTTKLCISLITGNIYMMFFFVLIIVNIIQNIDFCSDDYYINLSHIRNNKIKQGTIFSCLVHIQKFMNKHCCHCYVYNKVCTYVLVVTTYIIYELKHSNVTKAGLFSFHVLYVKCNTQM